MKKIWIWNHYATNMFTNQAGRHYWFAENLIKRGYNVTVFCATTEHNKIEYIDTGKHKYKTDKINDIPFVFVKTTPAISNGLDRIKNMILFFWNIFFVAKDFAKKNGKPDIILASSVHPLTLVAGIKVAKKFKIPCICEVRDLWPEAIFNLNIIKENSLLGKTLLIGEKWIYEKADALIFTQEGAPEYIKEKKWDTEQGGKVDFNKTYYINNGVDVKAFEKSVTQNHFPDIDLDNNKFKAIYTGSLRKANNIENILDAAILLKDQKDVELLIYGDGNHKDLLQKRIEEENLSNVKLKGYVNRKFIPSVLSRSSVNIQNYMSGDYSKRWGNSLNKFFEYMASGKPIISTVKTKYSIIDKYNCGIELENGSAKELADAIIEFKNMPGSEYKEMSNNAKEGAKDFDFEILTNKLEKIINNLAY